MNRRLRQVVKEFTRQNIDALLVANNTNITYLSEFPASDSWLLVCKSKVFYITDARYVLEAKQGLKGITVKQHEGDMPKVLFDLARSMKVKRLGFDERDFNVLQFKTLKKFCPKGRRLVAQTNLIENFRVAKDKQEIAKVKKALKLHKEALRFLKRIIKPGITERSALLKLEQFVKSRGALFSFDPIIASGPNSCYPHASVTNRKIRNNEPVMIDFGIDIDGYKSDLTRMFFLGKIPKLIKEVNDHVAQAQRLAIAKIKPGLRVSELDYEARNYLEKQNLAKYFGHALGHGVGLDIHEAPRLSQQSNEVLKEGMIITIEPAVYIPNKFGIRIEDMALVTNKGFKILSGDIHQ